MYLSEFSCSSFRNLTDIKLPLSKEINIIYGNNAAGKSSFLEAVCYLVSGRSFRTSKQNLMISHDFMDFTLFGEFSNKTKLGVSYFQPTKFKRIKLDGQLVKSLSSVTALYPVQVLSPESYHLIDSGPLERRKYIDWLLFHVEQSYQSSWSRFHRLLKQRNSYLRNNDSFCKDDEFSLWDVEYAKSASVIDGYRSNIVDLLEPCLKQVLEQVDFELTNELRLSYYSGYTGRLMDRLVDCRKQDLASGNTQYGPHKAELRIRIGKYLAKDLLSRGQKKLLVNALYLAQTKILKQITQKDSLFIIDDFSSELDESNQALLIDTLRLQDNVQIILSCLHPDMIKPFIKEYNGVAMFHVEQGEIKKVLS